jgi:hypothetical protein
MALSLTKDDRPIDATGFQSGARWRRFTDFTPADEFAEPHLRFLVLAETLSQQLRKSWSGP